MRQVVRIALFSFTALALFAQTDRSTITGTVTDPAGAVVSGAAIEARNVDNGSVYQAGSSSTGNYTLNQLPTGNYELAVTMAGFKSFRQQNIAVPVAQTLRINVGLEVGSATESITVTDSVAILKTESAELSHNVQTARMNDLPVLAVGTGAGARNAMSAVRLIPGASYVADNTIKINGMPANTQSVRIEGQDAQSGIWSMNQSYTQQSVDAIQEISIQTSNYAAEYGQAGGGVFNTTMKSGTNQYHGSAYNYLKNEAFNAGVPNTNRAADGRPDEHRRNRLRQNDYGFTFGGPISIPKLYNGQNRSFLFFSFEQFRETQVISTNQRTVPIDEYRNGDFRKALGAALGGTDKVNRPILMNQLYDPFSESLVQSPANSTACPNCTGQLERVRQPFATNNVVPVSYFDPVALAVQAYMPKPNNIVGTGLINNYIPVYKNPRTQTIPSFKIDQNLSSAMKLSGYYGLTSNQSPNADGLPYPITGARGVDVETHTIRINYDYTVTPTMLFHIGVGYLHTVNREVVEEFDVRTLGNNGKGLQGTGGGPYMFTSTSLNNMQFGGYSQQIGPSTQTVLSNLKPTGNISLSWVRNNHSLKFGGEFIIDAYPNKSNTYAAPWIGFSATNVTTPSVQNAVLTGGASGFNYASFLMGRADTGFTSVPNTTRLGKHALSGFAQDNWKVTRKLTVEYGLRYDFQTYLKEHSGYQGSIGPNTPNPIADGRLGGTIFEGYGPGKCNCAFAKNYPWAFGPRLSFAYQLNEKTVVRAGFGISYTRTAANNFQSYAVAGNTPYSPSQYGDASYLLKDGLPYKVTFPNFDPGQLPYQGLPASSLNFFDQNAGRPARTMQYTFFLQRQLTNTLVIEAGYVGNRGVWFQNQNFICDTCIQPGELAKSGLDITNTAHQNILAAQLSSPLARQAGYGGLPYSRFPNTRTVREAFNPFPMYTTILRLWAPVGGSSYDALQTSVTKRYSHGLEFNANLTWSKQLSYGAENETGVFQASTRVNDVFNRAQNKSYSSYDQPFVLVVSGSYTTPRWGNAVVSQVVKDWQLTTVLRYGSGTPAATPTANNNMNAYLSRGTFADRVPGVPIYLKDPNCKCFDPNKETILNPAAWANPARGTFGNSAGYYTEYRNARRPDENIGIARNFRMGPDARYNLQVRAEFANMFNRWSWPSPAATSNPFTTARTTDPATGLLTGGFGFVDTRTGQAAPGTAPRSGTFVARFTF